MKKLLLIDYYGTCDPEGSEVGHSSKVLEEYSNLINSDYEVNIALSPCLIKKISERQLKDFCKIYSLKYDICMENLHSVWKRIKDKFKLFYNLHQVFKIDDCEIMWFYRTDFFLALYLMLFVSRGKKKYPKIVILIYQSSFGQNILGRMLDYIYYTGFNRVDAVISTQKGFRGLKKPILYIPDYYYDPDKYKKYQGIDKEDKVVCVGTISPYKQVVPLVKVFNTNGLPLEIRGRFYDQDQYRRVLEDKNDNIMVENAILSEEIYYQAIASARYAVLPYDMNQYQCRTSGVLQECVFLNTIPIAPVQLLQENQIEGIGYKDIEELADRSFWEKCPDIDYAGKRSEFDRGMIGERLKRFLDDICK